jgi:protein-S-isoprenylcysteine O-methyltransferase Ste14
MNNDLIYRLALLAVLAAFVVHRGYYTKKYDRPESETVRSRPKSATEKLVGGLNLLALLTTAVYLLAPGRLSWAALPFPAWLHWAGVGVALLGFALLQWAHNALSRNWSDTPRLLRGQTLVTIGPYGRIRHPIYTAFLLILSAPLFISANWLVGLLWIASTALEVAARIRFEESLLAEQFGEEYRHYMAHTGRLLPRL